MTATPEGLGTLVGQLAEGISTLVSQHIQLARVELAEDARQAGAALSKLALYLPFLVVGYALLCTALSLFLSRWLGMAGGFCVVGGLNVAGASLGTWQVVSQMRQGKWFGGTVRELERSAALLAQAKRESR